MAVYGSFKDGRLRLFQRSPFMALSKMAVSRHLFIFIFLSSNISAIGSGFKNRKYKNKEKYLGF